MIDIGLALLSLVAGLLLGAFFFGGLWWTVRHGMSAQQPAIWFAVSLLLRMSISFAAFYAVSANGWQNLLLSLLGFVVARTVVTRFTAHAPIMSHAS
jgi:F1F0 ATPase subunit 2